MNNETPNITALAGISMDDLAAMDQHKQDVALDDVRAAPKSEETEQTQEQVRAIYLQKMDELRKSIPGFNDCLDHLMKLDQDISRSASADYIKKLKRKQVNKEIDSLIVSARDTALLLAHGDRYLESAEASMRMLLNKVVIILRKYDIPCATTEMLKRIERGENVPEGALTTTAVETTDTESKA